LAPTYYRGCWHVVSRALFLGYRPSSSPRKGVYNPKAFVLHAALLRQAFAHCAIFLAAATRRYLVRVSVPVWGSTLSRPLPVFALVSRYLTNQLMGRWPLPEQCDFRRPSVIEPLTSMTSAVLARLSPRYPPLQGRSPTCYSPVRHCAPESAPFDLHALGTPLAFILSQDQTLHKKVLSIVLADYFSS
jgi:hypothetical protein